MAWHLLRVSDSPCVTVSMLGALQWIVVLQNISISPRTSFVLYPTSHVPWTHPWHSASFLADISVSSPRKIFICTIYENIFWMNVSKNIEFNFENRRTVQKEIIHFWKLPCWRTVSCLSEFNHTILGCFDPISSIFHYTNTYFLVLTVPMLRQTITLLVQCLPF